MVRRIGALVLGAVLVVAFAPSAQAAVIWHDDTVSTPNVPNGSFDAVDCPSTSFCAAVGSAEVAHGAQRAIAELERSGVWKQSAIPTPGDAADFSLHGVDCRSRSFCVAVGEYTSDYGVSPPRAMVSTWDGSSWTSIPLSGTTPDDATRLRSVSCAAANFCIAVGEIEVSDGSDSITSTKTLIEYWDGSSWRVVGSPSPDHFNRLRGVSCPTTTYCVAVGTSGNSESEADATAALREVLTPQGWVVEDNAAAAPAFTRPDLSGLYAVDCTSPTFCLDTGWATSFTGGADPIADAWDGTGWTRVQVTSQSGDVELAAVSCPAPTSCTVLGRMPGDAGTTQQTQVGRWNGTTVTATGTVAGDLPAVSCTVATRCTAVGTDGRSVITSYDGTQWNRITSVNRSGDRGSVLTATSCVSVDFCLAVGRQLNSAGGWQALAEQYTRHHWAPVAAPTPAGGSAQFVQYNAVSCPSTTFCVAAGSYATAAGRYVPLLQVWDGTSWTAADYPHVGYDVNAVSCSSTSFCLAVGHGGAVRWDGTSWTSVARPKQANDFLGRALSCVSATDCTLVGDQNVDTEPFERPEIQHWDGSDWAVVAAPAGPADGDNLLFAVSCVSAHSCVAVGVSSEESNSSLLFTWDGTSWRSTSHPARPATLTAVSCASAGNCVATGQGDDVALSSHNGVWTDDEVYAPAGATTYDLDLNAVSCIASGECHAVGSYTRAAGAMALAESRSVG